jgi:hypothetical protein
VRIIKVHVVPETRRENEWVFGQAQKLKGQLMEPMDLFPDYLVALTGRQMGLLSTGVALLIKEVSLILQSFVHVLEVWAEIDVLNSIWKYTVHEGQVLLYC